FGWQVEVLFSNKGYKQKFEDHTANVSLNYLNLPILLVYRPINSLEFELGPELGYLISGESLVNSFDFGLDIGARYNISSRFNFGLRYNNGFPFKMNIDESSNNDVTPKYSNSVIQFYLGFNLTNELKESP
nr:PorT family protein [Bacteroidota bacterium]